MPCTINWLLAGDNADGGGNVCAHIALTILPTFPLVPIPLTYLPTYGITFQISSLLITWHFVFFSSLTIVHPSADQPRSPASTHHLPSFVPHPNPHFSSNFLSQMTISVKKA